MKQFVHRAYDEIMLSFLTLYIRPLTKVSAATTINSSATNTMVPFYASNGRDGRVLPIRVIGV